MATDLKQVNETPAMSYAAQHICELTMKIRNTTIAQDIQSSGFCGGGSELFRSAYLAALQTSSPTLNEVKELVILVLDYLVTSIFPLYLGEQIEVLFYPYWRMVKIVRPDGSWQSIDPQSVEINASSIVSSADKQINTIASPEIVPLTETKNVNVLTDIHMLRSLDLAAKYGDISRISIMGTHIPNKCTSQMSHVMDVEDELNMSKFPKWPTGLDIVVGTQMVCLCTLGDFRLATVRKLVTLLPKTQVQRNINVTVESSKNEYPAIFPAFFSPKTLCWLDYGSSDGASVKDNSGADIKANAKEVDAKVSATDAAAADGEWISIESYRLRLPFTLGDITAHATQIIAKDLSLFFKTQIEKQGLKIEVVTNLNTKTDEYFEEIEFRHHDKLIISLQFDTKVWHWKLLFVKHHHSINLEELRAGDVDTYILIQAAILCELDTTLLVNSQPPFNSLMEMAMACYVDLKKYFSGITFGGMSVALTIPNPRFDNN